MSSNYFLWLDLHTSTITISELQLDPAYITSWLPYIGINASDNYLSYAPTSTSHHNYEVIEITSWGMGGRPKERAFFVQDYEQSQKEVDGSIDGVYVPVPHMLICRRTSTVHFSFTLPSTSHYSNSPTISLFCIDIIMRPQLIVFGLSLCSVWAIERYLVGNREKLDLTIRQFSPTENK